MSTIATPVLAAFNAAYYASDNAAVIPAFVAAFLTTINKTFVAAIDATY